MDVDLSRVLDGLPAMVWTAVPDGRIDFVNQRWSDYTGLSLGEADGWTWQSVVNTNDLAPLLERWRSILASGQPGEMEARIRRFDGQYRWFLVQTNPIRDDEGRIIKWCGVSIDVDDRKRAEDDLRASECDARQIMDGMPGMIAIFTPGGEVEGANGQILEYFGKTFEELKNWRTSDSLHPEDLSRCIETFTNAIASGEPFELECRSRRFDGAYRWFQSRGHPFRDSSGRIVRWYNQLIDIDDRKRAEGALRESEYKLRQIVEAVPVIIWSADPTGRLTHVNRRLLDYSGMRFEEFMHRGWEQAYLHPADRSDATERYRRAIQTGTRYQAEARLRRADGEFRWHRTLGEPLRDREGRIIQWYGLSIDIDEAKKAEDQLRRSEALLAKGESASLTGTFVWDFATGNFTWSEELYRIYEIAPGSPITFELIATRYHPEDKATIANVADRARSGEVANFDYGHRLLMPNGSIKHIHVVAHRSRNEDGRIEYFGAVQDVTQRYLADEARRLSEGRWRRIVDNSAIGIAVTDLEGRFEIVNAAFQKLTGFTEDELRGMTFIEITESRFRNQNSALTTELLQGERDQFNIEKQYRCKDGRLVWVRNNVSLLPGPDGTPRGIMAIVEDITSRKAAEESLRLTQARLARAAEVATAAELSVSIAHEVNQPLSGIITNANTCLRMLGTEPPNVDGARETARRTLRDGNRASDIVTRLRALFSKRPPMLEVMDLNEATREVIALLLSAIQANQVILKTEFAGDLPLVKGDRVQLQQVILNLIQNGIDSVTAVDDRARQLLIMTKQDEGGRISLAVKDTGIGLAPEAMARMFDSFYTTKSNGMGVGLAVSRSIIETHQGRLWAEPNDGPGVTFFFSIPRHSKDLTSVSGPDAAPTTVGVASLGVTSSLHRDRLS